MNYGYVAFSGEMSESVLCPVLLPLNSQKLSPVCSSLFYLRSVSKLTKFHGVKFGSQLSWRCRALSWVTAGHGGLKPLCIEGITTS